MEVQEREIRVGENRLFLGEDNLLYIIVIGEIDENMALEFKEAIIKFDDQPKGKKRNVLVDNNKAGKISSEGRKIFNELCGDGKTGKVAVFGLHPVAKVLASFIIGVTNKKDMRFFKSKEEALEWLRE